MMWGYELVDFFFFDNLYELVDWKTEEATNIER